MEWARFGIRVNAVAPGVIETPLIKTASPIYVADFKERKPLSRMGDLDGSSGRTGRMDRGGGNSIGRIFGGFLFGEFGAVHLFQTERSVRQ